MFMFTAAPREANTHRDGWPTSEWFAHLGRHMEAVLYAMPRTDPMRDRVESVAGSLRNAATARDDYPPGVCRGNDIERRRVFETATALADGAMIIMPTLEYDADRYIAYCTSRGW